MTSDKGYPRQAAQTLRQGRRALLELEVAKCKRLAVEAQRKFVEATEALQKHVAQNANAAPQPQVLSALTMQRQAAFTQRQATQARRLRDLVTKARTEQDELEAELARIRLHLAQAHADEQVLERDRERFVAHEKRAREHKEQIEQGEQHASQRPKAAR